MARAEAAAGVAPPPEVSGQLFARKSSGLIKGWSAWDAFRYAFWCTNPMVLGLWAFSLAPLIGTGSLFWAAIIETGLLLFAVATYAVLITIIPRAGGDYVYQSRILHGGLGFVIACTGVWFIMAHWAPIYANSLVIEVIQPMFTVVGLSDQSAYFATSNGIFVASLITIAIASTLVAIGMKRLARVQTWAFGLGSLGLVVFFGLLLFSSKADFISAFNDGATRYYGAGPDAYQATIAAGQFEAARFNFGSFKDTMLLVPLLLFWNVYIIWGAALAGEIRGIADYRRNLRILVGALALGAVIALAFFALAAKTMGWDFYNSANYAYWGYAYGLIDAPPVTDFPYPVFLASWLMESDALRFLLIVTTGAFVVGMITTLFLTPTRMIFAAAFDRVLPEWAARIAWGGVPVGALVLMIIPSIIASALYAYTDDFVKYTLDAVAVLVVTFLVTGIAAILLPWRAKALYRASPFPDRKLLGIPIVVVFGLGLALFIGFCLVAWLVKDEYGVNNGTSLVYMGVLYVIALVIYGVARTARARQGIPLADAQREIPVD